MADTPSGWPLKLEQAQGLRLKRGDVITVDQAPHAVVGYDGRDEVYLCWFGGLDRRFDTRKTVRVLKKRAHGAPRDTSYRWIMPPLPAIDHVGRLVGETPKLGARSEAAPPPRSNLDVPPPRSSNIKKPGNYRASDTIQWPSYPPTPDSALEDGPLSRCASSATTRAASPERPERVPVLRLEETPSRKAAPPEPSIHATPLLSCDCRDSSGPIQRQATEELPLLLMGPKPKACFLCTILKCLASTASQGLLRLGLLLGRAAATQMQQHGMQVPGTPSQGHRAGGYRPAFKEEDMSKAIIMETSELPHHRGGSLIPVCPSTNHARQLAKQQQESETPRRDAFEDLQITIPIVRPPGWQEIQPLLAGKAVTFDERGLKETMTVKANRWCSFVDRQRLKLEREIREARGSLKRQESSSSAGWEDHDEVGKGALVVEDDISELEQMVDRMDDWKDLSRYSGKSVSMASTRRGNEMKIHVIAFAEREDGTGVDFMRLCYRKSVEVRSRTVNSRGHRVPPQAVGDSTLFGSSLRNLLPFLGNSRSDDDDGPQEQWIQLLQRPDVAKFTIALAFRNALENDGVHFQFCDARLDDPSSM